MCSTSLCEKESVCKGVCAVRAQHAFLVSVGVFSYIQLVWCVGKFEPERKDNEWSRAKEFVGEHK